MEALNPPGPVKQLAVATAKGDDGLRGAPCIRHLVANVLELQKERWTRGVGGGGGAAAIMMVVVVMIFENIINEGMGNL